MPSVNILFDDGPIFLAEDNSSVHKSVVVQRCWRTTQQSTFCFGLPAHQILIPSKMYWVTLLNNWFIETNEHQKPSKSSHCRSGRAFSGLQLLFTNANVTRLSTLLTDLTAFFTERREKKVPFSLAVGNLKLTHECLLKHLRQGTARIKQDRTRGSGWEVKSEYGKKYNGQAKKSF